MTRMSVFPPGLEPLEEVGAAAWVQEALAAWPDGRFRTRDLVPPVFEAYARILHGTGRAEGNVPTGTWGELATAHGVDLDPETSFAELSGLPPESREWDGAVPMVGSLTESEVPTLRRALQRHTATPERCLFLLWAGYGFLSEGGGGVLYEERSPRDELRDRRETRAADRRAMRFARRFAKIELLGRSGRTYFLLSGPVSAAGALHVRRALVPVTERVVAGRSSVARPHRDRLPQHVCRRITGPRRGAPRVRPRMS